MVKGLRLVMVSLCMGLNAEIVQVITWQETGMTLRLFSYKASSIQS